MRGVVPKLALLLTGLVVVISADITGFAVTASRLNHEASSIVDPATNVLNQLEGILLSLVLPLTAGALLTSTALLSALAVRWNLEHRRRHIRRDLDDGTWTT